KTQVFQRNVDRAVIENTHDALLAVRGGQCAHAQVDLAVGDGRANTAVLRQSAFADVQVRHDLQSRDDRGVHRVRRGHRLEQNAVNAVTDAEKLFFRLDVNIA